MLRTKASIACLANEDRKNVPTRNITNMKCTYIIAINVRDSLNSCRIERVWNASTVAQNNRITFQPKATIFHIGDFEVQ